MVLHFHSLLQKLLNEFRLWCTENVGVDSKNITRTTFEQIQGQGGQNLVRLNSHSRECARVGRLKTLNNSGEKFLLLCFVIGWSIKPNTICQPDEYFPADPPDPLQNDMRTYIVSRSNYSCKCKALYQYELNVRLVVTRSNHLIAYYGIRVHLMLTKRQAWPFHNIKFFLFHRYSGAVISNRTENHRSSILLHTALTALNDLWNLKLLYQLNSRSMLFLRLHCWYFYSVL